MSVLSTSYIGKTLCLKDAIYILLQLLPLEVELFELLHADVSFIIKVDHISGGDYSKGLWLWRHC